MKKALQAGRWLRNINVPLLVFLILFLNVKFVIKVFAIVFLLLYERNFHFGLSFKRSRLPLFYFGILVLEAVKYLVVVRNYSLNYLLVFGMGMLQWLFCLLAIHHLKLFVDRDSTEKIHNTIRAFYLANFAVSLLFVLILILHPAWLTTYWGAGADISINHPSAGDTILGISFDSSTANATINCLGLIYFLYKRDLRFSILCLLVIISCTSNTTFIFMEITLLLMVLTVRSKALRVRSLVAMVSMVVLYLLASAHNREYIRNYFVQLYIVNKDTSLAIHQDDSVLVRNGNDSLVKAPVRIGADAYKVNKKGLAKALDNLLSIEERPPAKERSSEVDSIEKGKLADSTIYPVISETAYKSKPGKLISFAQTYFFLKMNARHLLFGAGVGNFSSKLAFRVSGIGVSGTYPQRFGYVSPEFRYNHLKTYQFYAGQDASRHSVLNFPFSVYNQISGEYGLLGIALFVFGYLWYFVSRFRRLSYGRYMLCALLAFSLMEYWFELFTLVIVFELFLLLNIREGRDFPARTEGSSPDRNPLPAGSHFR
ncbi:MAG TPA: hypothetical protein VHE34_28510 [Puia sp.]|uniref:hypothetical protein n=1 Tax=Puia sp. TaxID=2045100 RepID=UPI002C296B71|nr:hypothetical protein [Puia sp.]HVU99211.1 hypothetical protein [Puia sp.]